MFEEGGMGMSSSSPPRYSNLQNPCRMKPGTLSGKAERSGNSPAILVCLRHLNFQVELIIKLDFFRLQIWILVTLKMADKIEAFFSIPTSLDALSHVISSLSPGRLGQGTTSGRYFPTRDISGVQYLTACRD